MTKEGVNELLDDDLACNQFKSASSSNEVINATTGMDNYWKNKHGRS
jgi:hypothetical protein